MSHHVCKVEEKTTSSNQLPAAHRSVINTEVTCGVSVKGKRVSQISLKAVFVPHALTAYVVSHVVTCQLLLLPVMEDSFPIDADTSFTVLDESLTRWAPGDDSV